MKHSSVITFLVLLGLTVSIAGCGGSSNSSSNSTGGVPADIQKIFDKPMYKGAKWGLRVVEGDKVLIDLRPKDQFFIGSVRKVFTIGELLNEVGPDHTYDTPVYRQGSIASGVLNGDLIVLASGDLTMGGKTNPDGSIAVSDFDHNEADSLGNAQLTAPNPLAGYITLAQQIAAAGIKEITGEIAIDDRLFQPYFFRGQFNVLPIFVNDDLVDMTINPTAVGAPASVVSRPLSAAFTVDSSNLFTSASGSQNTIAFDSEPTCIGKPGCTGDISGQLPIDFVPPLTNAFPLIQVFRIVQPANYARTVLIEALQAAGVKVDAPVVEENPVQVLPAKNSYSSADKVAQLTGMPYGDYSRFILKVSYNIGADTSLILWGLTQGVDNMNAALAAETKDLADNYGIPANEYHFLDGSGGTDTTAITSAVTKMLTDMQTRPAFSTYFNSLPIMGVDGSLGFVTDFESDPTLAGAKGHVHAKPGSFVTGTSSTDLLVKGQAFGGYIDARSGKRLTYQLVVNNVPAASVNTLLQIFQDQGTISAILWRDN